MIVINETPRDSHLEDVSTEADDPSDETESLQDSAAAKAPDATEPATASPTVNRSANIGHH